jgi:hypothetical protein
MIKKILITILVLAYFGMALIVLMAYGMSDNMSCHPSLWKAIFWPVLAVMGGC